MLTRLKPARGKAVRSLLSVLTERAGTAMKRHLEAWPWICMSCEHCRIDEGVQAPRAIRALADGRLACSLRLPLPCGSRPCDGFCPCRETDSNKKHTQATNGLPSCVACDIMGAPNHTSHNRRLALATQPAKALCTSNQTNGLAAHAVKALSILAGLQYPGSREAPAASYEPGSIAACFFLFPDHTRFFNG